MRWLRTATVVLAHCALLGCTEFPSINGGECGNGVIEDNERCDTFAVEGTACRAAGTTGACQLDCSALGADGSHAPCPAGWGCDSQGICRPPTGVFSVAQQFASERVSALLSGDFDGDGRDDLLSRAPVDGVDRSLVQFHYFDANAELTETRSFPKPLFSPVVRELSGDDKDDLVFSDGRIGVLRGRQNRALVPEAFGTYVLPRGEARLVPVIDEAVRDVPGVVALVLGDELGFWVPDEVRLRSAGTISRDGRPLVGEPSSGNLIEDLELAPCKEVVFAFRGETSFYVANVCERSELDGLVSFRQQLQSSVVPLSPPAPISAAPLLADVNSDGHLDVLVGTAERVYVAYGDGEKLAPAVPFSLVALLASGDSMDFSPQMPVAVADINGDGKQDFFFPSSIVLELPEPEPASGQKYVLGYAHSAAPWSSIQVGDFNGNGRLDFAAASNEGYNIDFFNGIGGGGFTQLPLLTAGPVLHLASGDFDQDSLLDLAYVVSPLRPNDPSSFTIAYGDPFSTPKPALIAELSDVDAFSAFLANGLSGLALSSNEIIDGEQRGVLTMMMGSADRLPYAPYEVTSFAADLSLQSWDALSVATGDFVAPRSGDVLTIGASTVADYDDARFAFWLLKSFESTHSTSRQLEGELDPRLAPASGTGLRVRFQVHGLSADFDGDSLSDALFAMPTKSGTQCGLVFVSLRSETQVRFLSGGTVLLDEPCPYSELRAVDADADGWVDVALLTGLPHQGGHRLTVLWNQGEGEFRADDSLSIAPESDSPEAFTLLPRTSRQPLRFVYVTERSIEQVTVSDGSRTFSAPQRIESLDGLSGVEAGDLNGDGVIDLAVAAAGSLHVLKAGLEP